MNRLPISSDQIDSYLLDIARRLPKPGERFRRTRLSDDQTSQLYSAFKEQLFRRDDRAGDQTQTTMWDAYNAVVEWVDREANALTGLGEAQGTMVERHQGPRAFEAFLCAAELGSNALLYALVFSAPAA